MSRPEPPDNIVPFVRKSQDPPPPATNHQCACGSQWFTAVVGFDSVMERVVAWSVNCPAPTCFQCGKEMP